MATIVPRCQPPKLKLGIATGLADLGAPPTPYIYDDRCNAEDAAVALKAWYDAGPDEREQCGQLGRKFVTDELIGMDKQEMCNRFTNSFEGAFKNWKPLPKYMLEVV